MRVEEYENVDNCGKWVMFHKSLLYYFVQFNIFEIFYNEKVLMKNSGTSL